MGSVYAKYLSNSRKIAVIFLVLLPQGKAGAEPLIWAMMEQFAKPSHFQAAASKGDGVLEDLLSSRTRTWNFERVMSVKRKLGVSHFRCRIQPGTAFADLRELTVADIQFSFEQAKAKIGGRFQRASFEVTKEALGFNITTSDDPDYLMSFLRELWIIPIGREQAFTNEPRGQSFYLGPYWLKEFSLGEKATLERHPGPIFGSAPPELEILLLPTLTQIKAKLTKSELDRVLFFDMELAKIQDINQWIAQENLAYQMQISRSSIVEGMLFSKQTKLFEDIDLRQRLNQAIDREALNQKVFDGFATYKEVVREPPTRLPAKIRPLQIFANQGSEIRAKLASLIIKDWQSIGVEAKLVRLPDATFFNLIRNESFQDIALVAFDENHFTPQMAKPILDFFGISTGLFSSTKWS